MAYLNRKIESKSILEKLSKVRRAEVRNSTYGEAIETLADNGLFVVIDPFETNSTASGIAWGGRYAEIIEGAVYYYDMASSYIEWNEAAADTIEDALDRLIDDIEEELVPQPEPEKRSEKTPERDPDHDPYPIE